MDVVFLDANVLFSAAYRPGSGLERLWRRKNIRLGTSAFAAAEARRNLDTEDRRKRLSELLDAMHVAAAQSVGLLPDGVQLPRKDRSILLSALALGAMHLLTGDRRHFGPYFGKPLCGVLVLPPAMYLNQ
jgi:predicted nucleic acid-binding protein